MKNTKDKTMPTNIHAGQDDELCQTFWFQTNQGHDYDPSLKEYTLVHNNPDYHVIKKSDVDGDALEALKTLEFCYESHIEDTLDEMLIDEDDTLALMKECRETIRNALIAQSDPDIVRIPRKVLGGMKVELNGMEGEVGFYSKMARNNIIDDILKGRTK